MKKLPQKPRNKPYFCHDENLEFLQLRKKCSTTARFISIPKAFGKSGLIDSKVINNCNKVDFHIMTHNTPDYRNAAKSIKIGIICIGLKDEEVWIQKIKKLIKLYPKHEDYYFKTFFITSKITVKNRKTTKTIII